MSKSINEIDFSISLLQDSYGDVMGGRTRIEAGESVSQLARDYIVSWGTIISIRETH